MMRKLLLLCLAISVSVFALDNYFEDPHLDALHTNLLDLKKIFDSQETYSNQFANESICPKVKEIEKLILAKPASKQLYAQAIRSYIAFIKSSASEVPEVNKPEYVRRLEQSPPGLFELVPEKGQSESEKMKIIHDVNDLLRKLPFSLRSLLANQGTFQKICTWRAFKNSVGRVYGREISIFRKEWRFDGSPRNIINAKSDRH